PRQTPRRIGAVDEQLPAAARCGDGGRYEQHGSACPPWPHPVQCLGDEADIGSTKRQPQTKGPEREACGDPHNLLAVALWMAATNAAAMQPANNAIDVFLAT